MATIRLTKKKKESLLRAGRNYLKTVGIDPLQASSDQFVGALDEYCSRVVGKDTVIHYWYMSLEDKQLKKLSEMFDGWKKFRNSINNHRISKGLSPKED